MLQKNEKECILRELRAAASHRADGAVRCIVLLDAAQGRYSATVWLLAHGTELCRVVRLCSGSEAACHKKVSEAFVYLDAAKPVPGWTAKREDRVMPLNASRAQAIAQSTVDA